MTTYLVPAAFGEAEYIEKKSRFLSRVWPIASEQEAIAHIEEMRKKHYDATHNVYAYILRENGIMRYSDDGEPGGTAGAPTLNALQRAELYNVCCVVTRYFGGILLGSGGLVRAYSKAAALAVSAAGKAQMRQWTCLDLLCPYNLFDRVKQEVEKFGGLVEDTQYGAEVTLSVCLPQEQAEAFALRLQELSGGKLTPVVTGQVCKAFAV